MLEKLAQKQIGEPHWKIWTANPMTLNHLENISATSSAKIFHVTHLKVKSIVENEAPITFFYYLALSFRLKLYACYRRKFGNAPGVIPLSCAPLVEFKNQIVPRKTYETFPYKFFKPEIKHGIYGYL